MPSGKKIRVWNLTLELATGVTEDLSLVVVVNGRAQNSFVSGVVANVTMWRRSKSSLSTIT
jgi:hypothetical protein